MEINMIDFAVHGDERGSLVAVEAGKQIPFEIKRMYYIIDAARDIRRGFHAHRELEQIMICMSGSCTVLLDDGAEKAEVRLDKFSKGLSIHKRVWHEMYDFEPGTVLVVLASDYYNEADYIRDYSDFIKYLQEN